MSKPSLKKILGLLISLLLLCLFTIASLHGYHLALFLLIFSVLAFFTSLPLLYNGWTEYRLKTHDIAHIDKGLVKVTGKIFSHSHITSKFTGNSCLFEHYEECRSYSSNNRTKYAIYRSEKRYGERIYIEDTTGKIYLIGTKWSDSVSEGEINKLNKQECYLHDQKKVDKIPTATIEAIHPKANMIRTIILTAGDEVMAIGYAERDDEGVLRLRKKERYPFYLIPKDKVARFKLVYRVILLIWGMCFASICLASFFYFFPKINNMIGYFLSIITFSLWEDFLFITSKDPIIASFLCSFGLVLASTPLIIITKIFKPFTRYLQTLCLSLINITPVMVGYSITMTTFQSSIETMWIILLLCFIFLLQYYWRYTKDPENLK